jgi:hypothetical protein
MAISRRFAQPPGMYGRYLGQGMDYVRPAPRKTTSLDELRARIELGRYEVKAHRVAEAMLRRGVTFRAPGPPARRG